MTLVNPFGDAAAVTAEGELIHLTPLQRSAPGAPVDNTVTPTGPELVSRLPMSGPEAAVVIAFLVVGAVLLVVEKPILSILGLFAGVGAVVVVVLARRVPKITWR
ncbi:hypothetical protein [Kitasatospora sp. CB01950]|uniref:hypothetical protein n=1 Tax=Kitasatospora sp. CB01950 TaxID=1703930 RepID=UPI0011610781|nr:hypothetical protein [Kitasatospora sp. CB01950]